MLRVLSCLAVQHDYSLVLLAAAICVTSCFVFTRVQSSLGHSAGAIRTTLIVTGALVAGAGIWTTHFIAMLAYEPGLQTGYGLFGTVVSLLVGVVFAAAATLLGAAAKRRYEVALAGTIFGVGIATMHYTGMAAFSTEGFLAWDSGLVAASIVLGAAFGAAAFLLMRGNMTLKRQLTAAGALTLAICAVHFTGMGAVTIIPSSAATVEPQMISKAALSFGVAGVTILIILGGAAVTALETLTRSTAHDRMRRLANAAQEALVIIRDDVIVDANDSFLSLLGAALADVEGRALDEAILRRNDIASDDDHAEGLLTPLNGGEAIPVEILTRKIEGANRDHTDTVVLALRDLRERRAAEARIRFLADHDSLTGLPNRRALTTRLAATLERAKATGEHVALLCLDLDNFKEANDVHGHMAGDALLVATAGRLRAALPAPSFAARLGGDEFIVVQIGQTDRIAEASALAADLIEALRMPVVHDGQAMAVGCSVGIALFPEDGADTQTLMANADMALYRAKENGRGTFRFFKREMDETIRDQRALARDLRQAIGDGQISVFYQPQVSALTGELCGFEALARWTHPTRGPISPADFIPLAESNALIAQLGEWVLRKACVEAASWDKPLKIAVNLSPLQVHQRTLISMVHAILLETGLSASRLELEITESALFKDFQRALDTLRGLKALGVQIAMDDFGTGFSSLSTLQSFPFDKIKIDKSFVENINRDERANVIVRAVLGIGRSLDIPVVAEGVETEEQIAFLRREDCAELQGYAIGRPAPPPAGSSLASQFSVPAVAEPARKIA